MEPTFCVWCEDDNVVEVWCVILFDRRRAVSRRTEGKTVSLLYDGRSNKRVLSFSSHIPSNPVKNRE
jgi:hypothetical protein